MPFPEAITGATFIAWASEQVAGAIAAKGIEKFLVNPIASTLSSRDKLKSKLYKLITQSCNELEKEYGNEKDENDRFPFYQSGLIVSELISYRLFKDYDRANLVKNLNEHPNIIPPLKEQIDYFFNVFETAVQDDCEFKELEFDQDYKERIFLIHEDLKNLSNDLKKTLIQFNQSLKNEYYAELSQFEKNINDFKPKSALEHIEILEKRVKQSDQSNNQILSKIEYLKGICYRELDQTDEKDKFYIQAYNSNPSESLYKSLATIAHFEQKLVDQAELMANEILKVNPFDEYAWVTLLEISKDFESDFKKIPPAVLNSIRFKTLFASFQFINNEDDVKIDKTYQLFPEFETVELPNEITFENKGYWATILNLNYLKFTLNRGFYFTFKLPKEVSEDVNLQRSFHILNKFNERYNDSEIRKLKKELIHNYLYTKYLVSGEKEDARILVTSFKELENNEKYAVQVLFALTQTEQFSDALDLIDSINSNDPTWYMIGMQVGLQKQDKELASKYGELFINKVKLVDNTNLEHILMVLDLFYANSEEKQNLLIRLKDNKTEISEIDEGIILTFSKARSDDNNNEEVKSELSVILEKIDSEDQIRRRIISNIYSVIGDYNEANSILKPFVDWDKPDQGLRFYIENLFFSNENTIELLELLENFRSIHIEQRFLIWEIDVLKDIPDWSKIEQIAELGRTCFPDNLNFTTYYLIALQQQSKKEKIVEIIGDVDNSRFDQDTATRLAKICILNNEVELAIKLMYPFAAEEANIIAREFYAFTVFLHVKEDYFKPIEIVEINTVVEYRIDGTILRLPINTTTLQNNPLAQIFYKKKIGDFVEVVSGLQKEVKLACLTNIYAKERALCLDIIDDIKNKPHSGYNATMFEWKGDAKDMLDEMVKQFGAKEEELHQKREEQIDAYNLGKSNFSMLTNSIFNGKGLNTYHFLTYENKCLRVIPLHIFRSIDISKAKNFVFDFSTLPLIYDLSNRGLIQKPKDHKFLVSQFIIDFLGEELYEAEQLHEKPISISVRANKATPNFYHKDYKQNRINYLKELINWTQSNCETVLVKEKLDVITRLRETNDNIDPYFHYIIDTAFLGNMDENILISDDQIYTTIRMPPGKMVSSEKYLSEFYKHVFVDTVFHELLTKHYFGLTVNADILMSVYLNSFKDSKKNFNYCLSNLPLNVNLNKNTVRECIEFIKKLYLTTALPDEKRRTSTLILVNALKGVPLNSNLVSLFKEVLRQKFELMGLYLDDVMEDFDNAVKIL